MKESLTPTLDDLRLECVLMQAWKKTSSYLRTHSWYADTLGIDYQSLRIPTFIAEIQKEIDAYADWTPDPLHLVLAPKTQKWHIDKDKKWIPQQKQNKDMQKRLRPLAHVSLRDQVVATAIMLCLADRVETRMNDPRLPIESEENRRRVLAYGHRLVCDEIDDGVLRHRWGSTKLYRRYFQDYRTFLRRPRVVAKNLDVESSEFEVAIVQSDLSKFYDRVQPSVLHQKVAQLRQDDDDSRFFEFAGRVFDWKWADTKRACRHARDNDLVDGFMEVALPQGLVASGFFANVVMQEFEMRLRNAFGQVIDEDLGITLIDAAYYVDDFRLVLKFPRFEEVLAESSIRDVISTWLKCLLDTTTSGLVVESTKTVVTVEGRDQRFLVPQSRAAQRIQGNTSGVLDMFHGSELIGVIEGFFHTQKMYSTETNPEDVGRTGLLVGLSDMRDETAARFAAGRFRRTFRSLRPILDSAKQGVEQTSPVSDTDHADEVIEHDLVLSKSQLDERAKLFAALLIEEWIANPANVRLLRVALDMYPDHQFLEEILLVLKPGWEIGASKGVRREVRLYCLAELFRAGATETGIVLDKECLPQGIDLDLFHNRLLREAEDIFNQLVTSQSSRFRLPWYLMQQVFLYLSARGAFPETLTRLGKKGGPLLALYRRFAKFIGGERIAGLEERSIFLIIAYSGFSLYGIVDRVVQQIISPKFLSHINACSPSTAAALWETARPVATNALTQTAERLGLQPHQSADTVTRLPDIVNQQYNPFFAEPNLLYLADWLLGLPEDEFDKSLTPWQIECEHKLDKDDPFGRIEPDKLHVRRDVNTAVRLFKAPEWYDPCEEPRRYQIGVLLRFAIRGNTDFFSMVSNSKHYAMPRYTRSTSHWEQQRYSGFQGRSAFGPPWIPISSFMENLLYELLRWPGAGVSHPNHRSLTEIGKEIKHRIKVFDAQYGAHSRTLFLEQSASLPYQPKNATSWRRSLHIGIVQTVIPNIDDYKCCANTPDLSDDPAFRSRHRAHLAAALEGVSQMQRLRDTYRSMVRDDGQEIDLLVFPELAVHPDDVVPLLVPFARKHRCILLFGMVYHAIDPRKERASLINSCQWLIPEWKKLNGFQLRTVEQSKFHLTKDEKALNPALMGFRPAQWLVDYMWSSDQAHRPLTITASVCYDATDLALVAELRSRSDLYIICALNRDVGTFDRMSEAMHYHMYQGVLLVNNGQFGGSSFFMPFDKPFHREVFHFHGQPQVAIAFAEICPEKLVNRPMPISDPKEISSGNIPETGFPVGDWKTPPSGWKNPGTRR